MSADAVIPVQQPLHEELDPVSDIGELILLHTRSEQRWKGLLRKLRPDTVVFTEPVSTSVSPVGLGLVYPQQ